ncbi:hypothetical protein SAMN05877809_10780 [Rhodobacter sp. JA431]|nr:hypothetical protein [Rhodobacter sp. JA431]SOC14145.1 hypothetical protein SAMN05877809_10780 [Rhodobacter sp. JA431]
MTNQIAIGLAVLVVLFFGVDAMMLHGSASLFLAKEMMKLTEWMAFWR